MIFHQEGQYIKVIATFQDRNNTPPGTAIRQIHYHLGDKIIAIRRKIRS
jgi:hypothetical protein